MRFILPLLLSTLLWAQIEEENLANWKLEATVTIDRDLHHVQGIDVEGDLLWISSVDAKAAKGYLSRIRLSTGKVEISIEVQDGKRIHPGGIQLDGDSIWMPVAEYDRDGPSWIERRDKRTLQLISRFFVDDHIGCVAVDANRLIGGSWSSRTLYTWKKSGEMIDRRNNPSATAWQDLKLNDGFLLGSGNLSPNEGGVEWVKPPEFSLVRRIRTGKTDRGLPFTHEGMAFRQAKLYFLPEDAPSRLFIFVAR